MGKRKRDADTDVFHYYNANPFDRITEDCVARAISTITQIPYKQVVMEMAALQCETGYDSCGKECIDRYLNSKGFIKMAQPRKSDNTKYTGKEFCRYIQRYGCSIAKERINFDKNKIVADIGGHHIVAIAGGIVLDTWDSTGGCIGNYWVKPL